MQKFSLVFAAAIVLLTAVAGRAQVAEKGTLTLEGAEKVIAAAKAEAKKLNTPGGVIAVVDDGGNLMALARLERVKGDFAAREASGHHHCSAASSQPGRGRR